MNDIGQYTEGHEDSYQDDEESFSPSHFTTVSLVSDAAIRLRRLHD